MITMSTALYQPNNYFNFSVIYRPATSSSHVASELTNDGNARDGHNVENRNGAICHSGNLA